MRIYDPLRRSSLRPLVIVWGLVACTSGVLPHPIPTEIVDEFTGPDAQKLDLLFVVDNSVTMWEEQELLIASIPQMYDALYDHNVDLHIGAVSTDMVDPDQSGRLWAVGDKRYIDESTENPVEQLTQLLKMGIDGDGNERGRRAAYTALETLVDTDNQGFYRPDATLAIITISDEEDGSGVPQSGIEGLSVDTFIDWLTQLKTEAHAVSYSVIVTPEFGCISGASPGLEYWYISEAVGGVAWSICEPEYATPLLRVADLMRINSVPFPLSQHPREETLEVRLNDEALDNDSYEYFPDERVVRIYTDQQMIRDTDDVRITYDPLQY